MAEKSALKKILIIVPAVLVLLVVGAFAAMNMPVSEPARQLDENVMAQVEPASAGEDVRAEQVSDVVEMADDDEGPVPELSDAELQAALQPRTLGDENAAVKITEFASLTCNHCGAFHAGTFKKLKEEYVDTGKAYIVFSDFPLNLPALEATMVARCLDEGRYFDFIQLLFESQDQWAYSQNYRKYLKQNAQLAGLSGSKFEACLNSDALREGLAASMQAVQKAHEISSTPSFVINDEETLTGGRSFEDFKETLDKYLK